MKKLCQMLIILLMALSLFACGSGDGSRFGFDFDFGNTLLLPETDETLDNWVLARRYQAAGRYELAQQYYSLALATVRTQSSLDMLKRELAAVDLQIQAMR